MESHFQFLDQESIQNHLAKRSGEQKLGEVISIGELEAVESPQFVLLGIQESIGVKGNLGIAGTHTAWEAFLAKFINIQANHFLPLEKLHLLGSFNFDALFNSCNTLEDYRKASEQVDNEVYPLIAKLIEKGHIPIIIGGSHANAYPLIKGTSIALNQAIKAVNLDAHADFRALEGRHSGNPFSYAFHEGYLKFYQMIGLHENYNNQSMLDEMQKQSNVHFYTFEDIFLRRKLTYEQALEKSFFSVDNLPCGIELDLDCIQNTLSSAMGPSGFSVTHSRQFAYQAGLVTNAKYLHLCEGTFQLENGQQDATIGKLLSYLATDFIKGVSDS